jgi:hypothetical protein
MSDTNETQDPPAPVVTIVETVVDTPAPVMPSGLSLDQLVQEALSGKYGVGQELRYAIDAAGYDHNEVDKEIARIRSTDT